MEIHNVSLACDSIFRRIAKGQPARGSTITEVLHQRFEQWISNLAVFALPHLSLDARLVYSDSLRNLVLDLLKMAERNLQRSMFDHLMGIILQPNSVNSRISRIRATRRVC
jgi:hypothetical protein